MIIKMSLSKSEKVLALLNQWDPAGVHEKSQDWRAYRYEAETICQRIRKNSSVSSVEKAVRETMEFKMDGKPLDDNEVRNIAVFILEAIKT